MLLHENVFAVESDIALLHPEASALALWEYRKKLDRYVQMMGASHLDPATKIGLTPVARFRSLRALAWFGNELYASRGYELLRAEIHDPSAVNWQSVGRFHAPWRRRISVGNRFSARLFRDGFHALAVLPGRALVAAVPGAIITRSVKEQEFRVTHTITRGTRPLHIAAVPGGALYWGEYFDNPSREEVHIYGSNDSGATWSVAYTFAKGAIRHVHNMVHDPWEDCLWILTGDYGDECRILRAARDFSRIETVLKGNQQARSVALVATAEALYFSSDTPLEQNYIYRLDRTGTLARAGLLSSSSIYGCRVADHVFFSTMVEPSEANRDPHVRVYGTCDGKQWNSLLEWRKDDWSMRFFQYGNAFLPDGENATRILAVSTIAVDDDDQAMTLYEIS